MSAGKQVEVTYERGGEEHKTSLEMAPLEDFLGEEEEFTDIGVTARVITKLMALAQQFPNQDGVLITGIRAARPFEAAKPAVQPGDVA